MRQPNVSYKKTSGKNFSAEEGNMKPEYKEGQILFVEDQKAIYVDLNGKRTLYGTSGVWYDGEGKVIQE